MPKRTPDPAPSQVIARRIREWRDRRGISAAQLAERVDALGVEMNRAIVANIEHGRRERITVEELLAFAAALAVPPVALVFPVGAEERVAATPRHPLDPFEAVLWFSGERPLDLDAEVRDLDAWKEASRPVRLYRSYGFWLDQARDAQVSIQHSSFVNDEGEERRQRERLAQALTGAVQVLHEMHEASLRLPELSPTLRESVDALGLELPGQGG